MSEKRKPFQLFLCVKHLEQFYREEYLAQGKTYSQFCWAVEKGILKVCEPEECRHCKSGVTLFDVHVAQGSEKIGSMGFADARERSD